MRHNILKYPLLFLATLPLWGVTACQDEIPFESGDAGEGDCVISGSVSCINEVASLDSRAAGTAIQNIDNFHLLVYSEDGTLFKVLRDNEISGYVSSGHTGTGNDAESAAKAEFKVTLPRGRYYIYGVANIPDLKDRTSEIATRDLLKSIRLQWNNMDVSKNSQMFGVFSVSGSADDSAPVVLNRADMRLSSWLKRAASKVTVAFDGSGLNHGVEIFIRDIKLMDIPRQCYLGRDNTPGEGTGDLDKGARRYTVENGLFPQGEVWTISDLPSNPTNLSTSQYYHVCKETHPYGGLDSPADDPSINDEKHKHSADHSFFFFENKQGKGKNKWQTIDKDGDKIWKPWTPDDGENTEKGWKDEKPYGTYVEVTGVYRNINTTSVGEIKYRFMLGQNIDDDYNATRNTHYRLTLAFRGNGNDADWHIEYDEGPGIYVVSPQYISYLYNKEMDMDVKVVGELDPAYGLKAEIVQNGSQTYWRPWGDGKDFPLVTSGFYYDGTVYNDGPWNSFLSLREPTTTKVEEVGSDGKPSSDVAVTTTYNQTYYEDNTIGSRSYSLDATVDNGDKNFKYTVSPGREESVFNIHLFTRAKELVTKTGFTGNNPYTSYPRKMQVRFTARVRPVGSVGDYELREKVVDIIQVRRVVNPKGVWRSWNNSDEFHVTLMRLPKEDSDFESFKSVGPWYAEIVEGDKSMITLESTMDGSGSSVAQSGNRIEGLSEHSIDFMIRFTGTATATTSRCALVKVRYHNYTCEHTIFVRQGFAPLALKDGDSKWSSYNIYYMDAVREDQGWKRGNYTAVEAKSPLDEGSYFKWNDISAILATNNNALGFGQDGRSYEFNTIGVYSRANPSGKFVKKKWSGMAGGNDHWGVKNPGAHVARYEDFLQLLSSDNSQIEKAYGVLYGDGATTTQSAQANAYGFPSDGTVTTSENGMRGCFVYNSANGRNIFFPIGKSGYGRRKDGRNSSSEGNGERGGNTGVLRYAHRNAPMRERQWYVDNDNALSNGGVDYQPLFFDLYKRPGAIYWLEQPHGTGGWDPVCWDINYYTMGFEGGGNSNVRGSLNGDAGFNQSDACLMRMVYE